MPDSKVYFITGKLTSLKKKKTGKLTYIGD